MVRDGRARDHLHVALRDVSGYAGEASSPWAAVYATADAAQPNKSTFAGRSCKTGTSVSCDDAGPCQLISPAQKGIFDDGVAAIHPCAAEVPGNGIDENCDGADGPVTVKSSFGFKLVASGTGS